MSEDVFNLFPVCACVGGAVLRPPPDARIVSSLSPAAEAAAPAGALIENMDLGSQLGLVPDGGGTGTMLCYALLLFFTSMTAKILGRTKIRSGVGVIIVSLGDGCVAFACKFRKRCRALKSDLQ